MINMRLMYILLISALSSSHITAIVELEQMNQASKKLFGDKPQAHLYWHAFLHAAKNNKDKARAIVQALQADDLSFVHALIAQDKQHEVDVVFDELVVRQLAHNPQLLSMLGIFESIGVRSHNAHFDDVSCEAILQKFHDKKEHLNLLNTCSLDNVSQDHKNAHRVISWLLNHELTGENFLFHEYRINQMFGSLFDVMMVLTQFHVLECAEDIEHYVARLQGISAYFTQIVNVLEHQKKQGITFPVFAIEKAINIMNAQLPSVVSDNIFYAHLAKKIEHIDVVDKETILSRVKKVIETEVYQAFAMLRDYCADLHKTLDTEYGVWTLPDGDEYYAYMLKYHTTTDLTPDQIHELGLKEVARIQDEMRSILAAVGIEDASKTVGELMQELAQDQQHYYANTPEGRQQCLAQYEAILDRCKKELHPLFGVKPKSSVVIKAIPKHEEEGMPGAYYLPPSIDGSRPGTFFANLRDMKEMPKYSMETLAIHEAEPGHHFQIAVQQESDMPFLAKVGLLMFGYTAYVEGWALYAEKLAYEQGFYSSKYAQLGHLKDELWRAVRLVVDTGIHKKRWTKEQAVDYMQQKTGSARSGVVTEIERYFVMPGQACSYKIGQLKFLELRQRAKDALGTKFSIQEFHDVVLKLGACPLTILEEVVDQYIQEKR